jgi:hypothetical protein
MLPQYATSARAPGLPPKPQRGYFCAIAIFRKLNRPKVKLTLVFVVLALTISAVQSAPITAQSGEGR